MTKGTVTCLLNKRQGEPSVNAEKVGQFKSGDLVEIIDVVEGDFYEGVNTWYKLASEIFIWSGCVSVDVDSSVFKKKIAIDEETEIKQLPKKNKKTILNNIYKGYEGTGKNVGVAILDSGINMSHTFIGESVKYYENFIANEGQEDIHPHGHKVAGVISSSEKVLHRNNTDLFIFKVSTNGNNVREAAVLAALDKIDREQFLWESIDVMNLSIDISSNSSKRAYYLPKIQDKINALLNKGIVAVIAGGELPGDQNVLFDIKNCIHVGTSKSSEPEKMIDFDLFFLDKPIPTYSPKGVSLDSNLDRDSAYTAYVSGILSRHIEIAKVSKNSSRLTSLKKYLNSISVPFENQEITPLIPYKK